MGNRMDTSQNGYERIDHTIGHMIQVVLHTDEMIDSIDDDIMAGILTALCADAAALGARLRVFSLHYKKELQCISIDQSNLPTA